MKYINWIVENKEAVASAGLAMYELIVRLKPTAKDWSVFSIIGKIFGFIVPNKSTEGGTH